MSDSARQFYASLAHYSDLDDLIKNGEAEGLYLECKAPTEPQLTRDMKSNFAKALSGFSNTAGGIIVWGISTTKHAHSGLDILTQIEPIGRCKYFASQIQKASFALTNPPVTTTETKTLLKKSTDTRGVVVTYIPKTLGDPIQSNTDNLFYFRSGDEFPVVPYEMLKRLFAATQIPDLHSVFDDSRINPLKNQTWEIPIRIQNQSSAIADHVVVVVEIKNPSACQRIMSSDLRDASNVNPGKTLFESALPSVVHRGLNSVAGTLRVQMKTGKRVLRLSITLYANRMRARKVDLSMQLTQKGCAITSVEETFLY